MKISVSGKKTTYFDQNPHKKFQIPFKEKCLNISDFKVLKYLISHFPIYYL